MGNTYDWYQSQSTDDLLVLKEDALNELFKLQSQPSPRKIKYWTTVFETIKSILKERENGR